MDNKEEGEEAIITYRPNSKIIDDEINQILNSVNVQVDYGKWRKLKLKDVCPLIQQWKVEILWTNYNNNSSITKAISEIEFPNLRMIFLYGNNIHSVETLSRIRMPTLCFLGIGHNFINFVNELSKGNWSLEKIYLRKNKIQELHSLSSFQCLKEVTVELYKGDDQQCCDISFAAKVPVDIELGQLNIKSCMRIKQQTVINVLRKKYAYIET